MMSVKKYISQYIILKILKGFYKENEIVSSENRLAIKFNCSRLTARSALVLLTNIGILDSFKGMGYLVSIRALSILFYPKYLKEKSSTSEFIKIKKIDINHPLIKLTQNECELYLIKNKNSLNGIISMSFLIIDKIVLSKFFKNEYKFDKNNPIEEIIDSSFIPCSTSSNFISVGIKGYKDEVFDLGYLTTDCIPVLDQSLFDNSGNCAIRSFNFIKKDEILFNSLSKVLTSYSKIDKK